MTSPPKKMLIELPAADEIDDLAITTPRFGVRKFEFDLSHERADLKYPPCKAQAVIVAKGQKGTALYEDKSHSWTLPSGRVGAADEIPVASKRIAREDFGLMLSSIELAGIYDVIWHYSDLTIKRLHFVYAGATDEDPDARSKNNVRFFPKPDEIVKDDISRAALADCRQK